MALPQEPPSFEDLKERVKGFPQEPGVYLMRGAEGNVIYVGKAKVLVNRVKSYFTGDKDIKTRTLVRRIHNIEFIVTGNEYEALILENVLIKEHNPRFNILLKDGKSYPMIRLTKEEFPRVFKTRRVIDDGSDYFGPFPNLHHLDLSIEVADKLFPLRKCKGPLKLRKEPCLYYHLGKCLGPCIGKVDEAAYRKQVNKVRGLLSGRTAGIQKDLTTEMMAASADLRFEAAADIRDTLKALTELDEAQKIIDMNPEQRDYVAMVSESNQATFVVLQMRGGKLLGRDLFPTEIYSTDDEAFEEFLIRYYSDHAVPTSAVYLSRVFEVGNLRQFFEEHAASHALPAPEVLFPEAGRHRSILNMANENATMDLKKRLETGGNQHALVELKKALNLAKLPHRIEGFDIAQLDGTNPVASLISFWNGNPDRKNYRKFHVKSLDGAIDDFQSMKEVVARRYSRLLNEGGEMPDLIMVDGGKGQVNSAHAVLQALGLEIPLVGLAKREEELFLPHTSDPIILPRGSSALRVLQAVRDETHRFATGFNQKLRAKTLKLSTLEGVPGIGDVRSRKLLTEFGSLEALALADPTEIALRGGIGEALAETVKTYLVEKANRTQTVKEMKRTRRS
ncbi:MAG: excinuclease ABC subunit UvrC [Spirochaetales bacterium]